MLPPVRLECTARKLCGFSTRCSKGLLSLYNVVMRLGGFILTTATIGVTSCGGQESATQVPARDYVAEYNALMESAQPPGENAWPVLLSASQRIKAIEDEVKAASGLEDAQVNLTWFTMRPDTPAEFDDAGRGREVVERSMQEGLFEELHKASEATRLLSPLDLPDGLLRSHKWDFASVRHALLALLSASYLSFEADDSDRAVGYLCAGLRLTSMISGQGVWIDRLLANSVRVYFLEEVRLALIERSLSVEQMRRLLDCLERAPAAPLARTFKAEHLALRQGLEVAYADDSRFTKEQLIDETRLVNPGAGIAPDELAPLDAVLAVLDESFEQWVRDSDRIAVERESTDEVNRARAEQLGPAYTHASSTLAVASMFFRDSDVERAHDAGTRVMLAIELFVAENDQLPELLDDLIPQCLSALPRDPITGGSLIYRPNDGRMWRQDYLLYVVGLDGEDNGGNVERWMQDVPLTNAKHGAGYDYVFNLPRFIQPRKGSR